MIMTLLLAGALSLSDAAKLEFTDVDQTVAQLKHQLVHSDDFADLSQWTEVDSGGNINLAGGVVSFDGNGVWNQNALWRTVPEDGGVEGYFEIKVSGLERNAYCRVGFGYNNVAYHNMRGVWLSPDAAYLRSYIGCYTSNICTLFTNFDPATWYTVRFWTQRNTLGNFVIRKIDIQGLPEFAVMTEAVLTHWEDFGVGVPMYFQINRATNWVGHETKIKEWRWYSGFSLTGPYMQADEDAGVNKAWRGDELTAAIAAATMPVGIATTNLTFQYSWDDGVAAWSGALTFANYKLVVLAGRKRYFRTRVIANSDGVTQVPLAMPLIDARITRPGTVMPTWGGGEVSGIH